MVRRALVLSLLISTTMAPAGALGAAWVSPPATVSVATGTPVGQPMVAANARGDSAIAWVDPATGRVFVSERPVGGTFNVGAQVSAATDILLGSIEIDDAGTIHVFYISDNSNPAASIPNVASKAIGAVSWTVTPLTPANNADPAQSMILGRIAPDGRGLVVWFQGHTADSVQSVMQFSRKAAGSSTWSAKATVSTATIAKHNTIAHQLALNAAGEAALIWGRVGSSHLFGGTMSAAGVWTTPNQITTSGTGAVVASTVGIDGAGTATAAWARDNVATPIIQFSTKAIGAASWPTVTFGSAGDLSPTASSAGSPAITVAPDGSTTVAWVRNGAIEERSRPAIGGAFAAATTIPSTLTAPVAPVLRRGTDGSTVAVWSGTNSDPAPKSVLGAARRPALGTAFTALPDGPGTDNTIPAADVDDQGNLTVAWLHMTSGPQYAVQATGLDLVGPLVSGLTFPASSTAGTAFSYGATLSDRWTTPNGTWAFGDGTTGPLSGTKSYAAGGSFAAQLIAADGAANTTVVDRTIDVVGPGGGPTGPTGPSGPAGPGGPTPGSATPDATAPVLSAASLTRTTFAVDPKGASVSAVKRGTSIRYTLSEAAVVRFTVERRLTGRRVGGRCRATTPANRRRPACTRFVAAGSFSQSSAAGKTTKRFAGRIAKRSLRVARYRLTLVATDAAGNRSAARRLTFRVVRR